jgi:hypothetical protein
LPILANKTVIKKTKCKITYKVKLFSRFGYAISKTKSQFDTNKAGFCNNAINNISVGSIFA